MPNMSNKPRSSKSETLDIVQFVVKASRFLTDVSIFIRLTKEAIQPLEDRLAAIEKSIQEQVIWKLLVLKSLTLPYFNPACISFVKYLF